MYFKNMYEASTMSHEKDFFNNWRNLFIYKRSFIQTPEEIVFNKFQLIALRKLGVSS
jgi:hypothetical protein